MVQVLFSARARLMLPSGAQSYVTGMYSQIAHHSVFTVEFHHALPVDRFFRIEIAGVEKAGAGLDNLTERPRFKHLADALYCRKEWRL